MIEHELAGTRLRAISIGGLETAIDLPGLRVAFDVGRCPPELVARETILFTHAHMDHMGGIAYHAATRGLRRLDPPTYVVPHENAADVEALLSVWRRLDGSSLDVRLVAIGPGEELRLRRDLVARPFRSDHVAPCQGYALVSERQKLLPGLAGADGAEIARLRRAGAAVTETVESIEVAFCGDTRIEVVEREPAVRRARLLILEVTFLDDRVPVPEARAKGHVHLDEVCERAALFENEAILFTHFSARYTRHEIERILERRLPAELAGRVTPLLPG